MNLNLLEECREAKRIGIAGHVRPDGDCLGACLGLWQYLGTCFPQAQVRVFLEKPADIFREIRGFEEIQSDFPQEEPFDVFFVLDSTADRTGSAARYVETAGKTVNIDHHISNQSFADENYIFPQVSSTSELIFELLEEVKGPVLQIQSCRISHDTGR